MQLIKQVIQSWNRRPVLDSDIIVALESTHISYVPSFLGTKEREPSKDSNSP